MGITELAELVRAGLDADELWATEASRMNGHPVVESGEHWHWACAGHDLHIEPKPGEEEFLGDSQCDCIRITLRSREEYPSEYGGTVVNFALPTAEEVPSAVGGHIARQDPARVLRTVARDRKLLDLALAAPHLEVDDGWYSCSQASNCADESRAGEPCDCGRDERVQAVLQALATPYQEAGRG